MKSVYGLPALLIGTTVTLVQPYTAVALTPVQVSEIAKSFTVVIDGDGTGSGVIFDRKGNTYFVITNRHVVSRDGRYEIHTSDGGRYPVYRSQELPGLDLAILQFTSNKNYRLASLGNSDQLKEGMTIYVVGWADSLPGINERSYQFTDGTVRSRLKNPEEGYALVYNNEAIPGMSGGPILDENARVVGINGRANTEVRKDGTLVAVLRLGIPINTFLAASRNLKPTTGSSSATAQTPSSRPSINTAGTSAVAPLRKPSAEALLSSGGAKANQGDYQGAIADYNQALRISPNNPDVYYRRALSYEKLKNYQAAIGDFTQVIRLSPRNSVAYSSRGYTRILQGNYKAAIADANQAIRLDPNLVWGYFVRGSASYYLQDYPTAVASFDRAIQMNSSSPYLYSLRGLVHYARKDMPKAVADFSQSIQRKSDNPTPYEYRGRASVELGNKSQAIADLQKAAALYKQEGSTEQYQSVVSKIKEIETNSLASVPSLAFIRNNPRSVIATANEDIQRNSKDDRAYFKRGIAYYIQGDNNKALEDLTRATRLNPRFSDAWYRRGLLLSEIGRDKDALTSYDRAIQANNDWGESSLVGGYLERGHLHSKLGNYQKATTDFDTVIRLNPKLALVYALRGLNYQLQGKNREAIADFNEAAKIDPNNAMAHTVRGYTYHLQKDFYGALAAYERAISLNAKTLPAVNNLGLVKYELGDFEGAIRQFLAAISIDSKSPEPQLALAVALYAKGDQQRGLAMAEVALRSDKRFANVDFLKKNLWGDRILADTQKLMKNPRMRVFVSR